MDTPTAFDDSDPVQRREHGLRRVGTATRWTATVAVAGTLALAAGYAHELPGLPTASAGSNQPAPSTGGDDVPGSNLQPPTQAPAPAFQPPQTSSGAS